MFTFNKDVTATNCEPGVTRKILCYSDTTSLPTASTIALKSS